MPIGTILLIILVIALLGWPKLAALNVEGGNG